MADIDVQRKGPSIWPWIAGLIVLALLVWAVAEMVDREDREVAVTETQAAEEVQPAPAPTPGVEGEDPAQAVEAYSSHIDNADMGVDANWTATAMNRMAAALGAIATRSNAGSDIMQRVDRLRQRASQVGTSPDSLQQHADWVREFGMNATDAMNSLARHVAGQDRQLQTAIEQTRQAAQNISQTTPLLQQREAVQRFFEEAEQPLERLASASTRMQGAQPSPGTQPPPGTTPGTQPSPGTTPGTQPPPGATPGMPPSPGTAPGAPGTTPGDTQGTSGRAPVY